jgi:hypothetical protein
VYVDFVKYRKWLCCASFGIAVLRLQRRPGGTGRDPPRADIIDNGKPFVLVGCTNNGNVFHINIDEAVGLQTRPYGVNHFCFCTVAVSGIAASALAMTIEALGQLTEVEQILWIISAQAKTPVPPVWGILNQF